MSSVQDQQDPLQILRALMEAHGHDVLRVLYSYVKDRHIAEDLSQEVFIKVYDHLDTFRKESSYKTWVLKIAINRAKDYLRSAASKITPVDDLTYLPGGESPEANFLAREEQRVLWHAMLSLPEIYRESLWLFYEQELTIEEIALVTQLSVATVKTRLHRGRAMLRKALEGRKFDERPR